MDLTAILSGLWTVLNSAPGVAVLSAVLLWALNGLYARKPLWRQYEGTIISAIRAAEKAIPDGTPMKSAERLDKALKLVLAVYAQRMGAEAPPLVVAQFAEAIQVLHAHQEAVGALDGPELR